MIAEETFQAAVRDGFGMFTVDRDEESQIFYDSRFFARMVEPMFDIASITPEAYFYQTAYLLTRRRRLSVNRLSKSRTRPPRPSAALALPVGKGPSASIAR